MKKKVTTKKQPIREVKRLNKKAVEGPYLQVSTKKKPIKKVIKKQVRRFVVSEMIEVVNNLRLTGNIVDNLNDLEYQKENQTYELLKLKREYELLKKRNSGLLK